MLGSTLREQPPCRYIAGVRLYPEAPMRWKGAMISQVDPVEIENYSVSFRQACGQRCRQSGRAASLGPRGSG